MGSRTGMRGTRAAWIAVALVAGAIGVGTGAGGASAQEVPGDQPGDGPSALDTQAGPAYETDSFVGLHGVVDGAAPAAPATGSKSPEDDTVDLGALPAGGAATAAEKVDVPGEAGVAQAAAADEPGVIPAPVGGGDSADDLRAAVAGQAAVGELSPSSTPGTTRVIVVLEDAGGRTRMHLTHEGVPAGSPGEMGWNMALDKMVARLAD